MIYELKQIVKKNEMIFNIIKNSIYYLRTLQYKFFKKNTIKRNLAKCGNEINLDKPKTLTDKYMFINLYNQHPLATDLADKYKVREYMKKMGYADLLVDLIGSYDSADEINFQKLPNKFVLKCNHGAGYNIICKNKKSLDSKKTVKQLNKWMKQNFAYISVELHYEKIQRKIICEKFLDDLENDSIIDYKLYCINGKYQFTQCCLERTEATKFAYYDRNWIKLNYSDREEDKNLTINKPINHRRMIEIAEDLSKPFDFVRVDFYEIKGSIIFGELTFTPGAGNPTIKRSVNEKLGQIMKITKKGIKQLR